ncbi:hypothetical protein BC940DRAFT_169576 [Gongronella butleri]|nr:hypothetical protein BC940DRAFT_169576 [Gongronella butleri]
MQARRATNFVVLVLLSLLDQMKPDAPQPLPVHNPFGQLFSTLPPFFYFFLHPPSCVCVCVSHHLFFFFFFYSQLCVYSLLHPHPSMYQFLCTFPPLHCISLSLSSHFMYLMKSPYVCLCLCVRTYAIHPLSPSPRPNSPLHPRLFSTILKIVLFFPAQFFF